MPWDRKAPQNVFRFPISRKMILGTVPSTVHESRDDPDDGETLKLVLAKRQGLAFIFRRIAAES